MANLGTIKHVSPRKNLPLESDLMLRGRIERLLWRLLAMLFVVLGVLGVLLPVVPTAPFLLAAAWAAGRGWPALELWLLNHPRYGDPIRQWRSGGVLSRRAKWGATLMMACSAILLLLTEAPLALKAGVPTVMAIVAIWLWRRPEEQSLVDLEDRQGSELP